MTLQHMRKACFGLVPLLTRVLQFGAKPRPQSGPQISNRVDQRLPNIMAATSSEQIALEARVANLEAEKLGLFRDLQMQRQFFDCAFRYFVEGERSPETIVDRDLLQSDSSPEWVSGMLGSRTIHEREFSLFRFFQDPEEAVLDIGANYGYSAASIWASGSKAFVLSFEANPAHAPSGRLITIPEGDFPLFPHPFRLNIANSSWRTGRRDILAAGNPSLAIR
jgi:hypothetical protein